ncbi:MAG TPA: hypothetical protein VLH80_07230 [Nitrospiraceae bacterium]|nr:hypothetical protein [Nitrospiraceae bacterium]
MVEGIIAFHGLVELINATWSLDSGRTVELRLAGEAFDRIHPFKKFQQRRNGKMGTRFKAVFARACDGEQVLDMEVMLQSWKDSSAIGQSITLWLDDEFETHPFCACTRRKNGTPGDMFALVLVELNDDESPVNQTQQELVSRRASKSPVPCEPPQDGANPQQDGHCDSPVATKAAGSTGYGDASRNPASRVGKSTRSRRFSSSVHLLITSPLYVRWLQETKGTLVKEWTPELARQYTKKVLHIESLSDLDRDPAAVKRFHEQIRRGYEKWAYQHP